MGKHINQPLPSQITNIPRAIAVMYDSRAGIITAIDRSGLSFRYVVYKNTENKKVSDTQENKHQSERHGFIVVPCRIITERYVQSAFSSCPVAM